MTLGDASVARHRSGEQLRDNRQVPLPHCRKQGANGTAPQLPVIRHTADQGAVPFLFRGIEAGQRNIPRAIYAVIRQVRS